MSSKKSEPESTMWVAVAEPTGLRTGVVERLEVKQISTSVNLFIEQMRVILDNSPEQLGKFQMMEIEVHAEISAEGQIILLGSGGKLGAKGGVKFTFRRAQ